MRLYVLDMAYDYDKLYRSTPRALGEPTELFVDFFKHQAEESLRVLDVGCGQGRDALFIARMGHCVDLVAEALYDSRPSVVRTCR